MLVNLVAAGRVKSEEEGKKLRHQVWTLFSLKMLRSKSSQLLDYI